MGTTADSRRYLVQATLEVAELAWFLCQPAAAAITGADFAIDFGYSAGK